MCRAGKDKTRRYCPATTNEEKKKEKAAYKQLAYMRKAAQGKMAVAEADIAAHPEWDKDQKEERRKAAGFKETSTAYKNHLEYAHTVISKLRETGKETHLLQSKLTSSGVRIWDEEREVIHNEIIMELLEEWKDIPCEGKALFSGGLGGAGKGTVLKLDPSVDQKNFATLNPDDIKEIMAKKGLIPEIHGLTPMEASPLVHNEASYITGKLAEIVTSRNMNVIHDLTMADYDSVKKKIENLEDMGYTKIDAIFVDIEIDTSDTRADVRHLNGHNRWLVGVGQGGRILPRGISAQQKPDDDSYRSKNAENFLALKAEGCFNSTVMYDNNTEGKGVKPILLTSLKTNVKPAEAA